VRTEESQQNIVALSDIREKKLRASSPYGPVKAGLTTLPGQEIVKESPLARLSELLNSLEREVESLNYKSFEAYATLSIATENLRAVVYDTVINSDFTDE
jgi:5-enolpyruvylshikimate-3-phosphate synthase